MVWVRLDDGFPEHGKALAAGDNACWLFVAGLCYCARNLTDGRIPDAALGRLTGLKTPSKLAGALVDAGLWERGDGEYIVPDYGDYQPLKEDVLAARSELSGKRARAGRKGANARWQRDSKPDGNAMANASQSDGPEPRPLMREGDNPSLTVATAGDERLRETVEILRKAPRLQFDPECLGVFHALNAHPAGDHVRAAHVAASNAADPTWRTVDAGKALRYAFAELDRQERPTSISGRPSGGSGKPPASGGKFDKAAGLT